MKNWRLVSVTALALGLATASASDAACCYFSAKNSDILQPAQKVFITWDPVEKIETFTVQPKFEGNALDFGMVIPTPKEPKLDPMPIDFFSHLAIYTIMKKRDRPQSKLLPVEHRFMLNAPGVAGRGGDIINNLWTAIDDCDDVLEVMARHDVIAATSVKRLELRGDEQRRCHDSCGVSGNVEPLGRVESNRIPAVAEAQVASVGMTSTMS